MEGKDMIPTTALRSALVAVSLVALPAIAAAQVAAAGGLPQDPSPVSAGAEILALYGEIHTALAADSAAGVREAAAALAERADSGAKVAADPAPYRSLAAAARRFDGADLAALREQFKGLSKAVAAFLDATGTAGAQLYYCPMAGGYWLQGRGDEKVRNPYYGAEMLRCGEKAARVGR